MKQAKYQFSSKKVNCYFETEFSYLRKIIKDQRAVIITDENILAGHAEKFKGYNTIVIKPGEQFKIQTTINTIVDQLVAFEADRKTFLIGVGGGVVTDLTGFAASVYMRGLKFGFVPTTLLAMVDASIGGKNGIDVGIYKNMIGTVNQPEFLLYDATFLATLPDREWANGFAEVIKHACIKDSSMFRKLEKNSISFYQNNIDGLNKLIRRNVLLKSIIVQKDEFEKGDRRLLNFGHTVGHAIENLTQIPHGHAVSVGMVTASRLSEKITGFTETAKVSGLLKKYDLPVFYEYDRQKVFDVLKMDKKRSGNEIHFVLLNKIGVARVVKIKLAKLEKYLYE